MTVPLPPPRLIDRPRLLRRMQQALGVGHLFLTAPAGYGKSTALHSLVAHRQHSYYLPLTATDRDITVLQAKIGPLLQPGHTVILDDVHLLRDNPETAVYLQSQLQHVRPRLVLSGRFLPFDAAPLLISGRAGQLARDDLAFSLAETEMLLGRHHPELPGWHRRLHGWSLALSLLARMPPHEDRLPAAEIQLFHYLAETVFKQLPAELLTFMGVTAVPLRFNITLAETLWTGSAPAAALLEAVRQRSLFLQADGEPGWWRYHDLIRDYLRDQAAFDLKPLARRTVAFFQLQDDTESAIEHALDAGLEEEAAQMQMEVSDTFLWDHARHLTFHRWVHALSPPVQEAYPQLWVRLAQSLHYLPGRRSEAWHYLRKAEARFSTHGLVEELRRLQRHKAWFHSAEGAYEASLEVLQDLLDDAAITGVERLQLMYQAGINFAALGRFSAAENVLDDAVSLAVAIGDDRRAAALGEKLALHVYIPRGQFPAAAAALEAVAPYYADRPSYRIQYLLIIADLYTARGDWPRLDEVVSELKEKVAALEQAESHQRFWTAFNEAWLAAAAGDWHSYDSVFSQASAIPEADPVATLSLARLAVWAARCRGMAVETEAVLGALADPGNNALYYRAALALEWDISAGLSWEPGRDAPFELHPETKRLAGWRCRADLVRLRALLAVIAYRAGDRRWRRHLRAALFGLRRRGGAELLTRRDPQLGAAFWPLMLLEKETAAAGEAILFSLGRIEPLLVLLEHIEPEVRRRVVSLLARLGRETAVPHLHAAQKKEKETAVQSEMAIAISKLISFPPPPLIVRCFGDFSLRRGDVLIPDTSWPRPIVYRLFCYFSLQQGRALTREEILNDLWPDTDPQKAWNSFRTIFSGLRKVLEPYLPPKAPLRYIQVTGEQFLVDPHGVMQVDARDFEARVNGILTARDEAPLPELLESLLSVLTQWQPLLPDLPLEEWLVAPRQRLQELYVEGSLLAGQGLLASGDLAAAVHWAQQATTTAPWLEEGYQVLMRACARQGQRTRALQIYETAVQNLNRELAVPPSPLTEWLVAQLRRGEMI